MRELGGSGILSGKASPAYVADLAAARHTLGDMRLALLLPCREMASKVAPYLLRRTADILTKHLPPLTQLVVFCRPSAIQVGCPARPPSVMCRCKQQAEALPLLTLC